MFNLVLEYLADPVYFGVFSLTIGLAYIIVWIVSLKEIGKTHGAALLRAADGEEGGYPRAKGPGRNVVGRVYVRKPAVYRSSSGATARNQARVTRNARVA